MATKKKSAKRKPAKKKATSRKKSTAKRKSASRKKSPAKKRSTSSKGMGLLGTALVAGIAGYAVGSMMSSDKAGS